MTDSFYDSARLEQQYLPWTDPQVTLNRWAETSSAYLRRANIERDMPYGTSSSECLDLLKPSTSNAPVLVFLHGGYWQGLDKDHYAFALEPLVATGALVASINYSLCPEVSLDALVDQVRAACGWVWRHVRNYGGDPERIHVAGHSAGGHLAAMMAATNWPKFQGGLPHDLVKSIIPISGLFDLEPIRWTSLNEAMGMDPEMARNNSPLFLTPTTRLRVSVVVGGSETAEFLRQSREFANAWESKAGHLEYIESPGHDHLTVIETMTEPDNVLVRTLLQQLEWEVAE